MEIATQPDDLELKTPAPQINPQWAHTRAVGEMAPSQERLAASSQVVTLRNRSQQVQVVYDRYLKPVELRGGESRRGVEMLTSDIEYFLRESTAGRIGNDGLICGPHPIEILDVGGAVQRAAAAASRVDGPPQPRDRK